MPGPRLLESDPVREAECTPLSSWVILRDRTHLCSGARGKRKVSQARPWKAVRLAPAGVGASHMTDGQAQQHAAQEWPLQFPEGTHACTPQPSHSGPGDGQGLEERSQHLISRSGRDVRTQQAAAEATHTPQTQRGK